MFFPFDDDLNRDFGLLTQHSLISVRVIAPWSQDHKLKTYMYLVHNVFVQNYYFHENVLKNNTVCIKYKHKINDEKQFYLEVMIIKLKSAVRG